MIYSLLILEDFRASSILLLALMLGHSALCTVQLVHYVLIFATVITEYQACDPWKLGVQPIHFSQAIRSLVILALANFAYLKVVFGMRE